MTTALCAELNDFHPWVAEAKRGQRCVYFVGRLGEAAEEEIAANIRQRDEMRRHSREVGPVEVIRNYVAGKVEAGVLTVVHRASGPPPGKRDQPRDFEYIAVKL